MPFFEPSSNKTGKGQVVADIQTAEEEINCRGLGGSARQGNSQPGGGEPHRGTCPDGGSQGEQQHGRRQSGTSGNNNDNNHPGAAEITNSNDDASFQGVGAGANTSVAAAAPEQATIPRPPDPVIKPTSPAGLRVKRIRFTGAMGDFLDGPTVWSDFAVMEAERKAHQLEATTSTGSNSSSNAPTAAAHPAPPAVEGRDERTGEEAKACVGFVDAGDMEGMERDEESFLRRAGQQTSAQRDEGEKRDSSNQVQSPTKISQHQQHNGEAP